MEISQEQIDTLVSSPSESLMVELKRWIDPAAIHGQSKIIKACLALRNLGGGFLVIGFDNNTRQPDRGNEPGDPRTVFDLDPIQGLISKFASEVFEVQVMFSNRDGIDYPVIAVQSGVKVPVFAKTFLKNSGGHALISQRDVFCRTLGANGTPSTALAQPNDWRDMLEICFDNREADIGRFLRRQLGEAGVESLLSSLSKLAGTGAPVHSLRDAAGLLLDTGNSSYEAALKRREIGSSGGGLAEGLAWEASFAVDPPLPTRNLDDMLLDQVLASSPRYAAWSTWLDTRGFQITADRPVRIEGGWQTLFASDQGWSRHLIYWLVGNSGFYARHALPDDLTDKVQPGTAFDPMLSLFQICDAIAGGLTITKALSAGDATGASDRRLGFSFRWTKLGNRFLHGWSTPSALIRGSHQIQVDTVTTYVDLPLDTPLHAIAPYVHKGMEELMAYFNGQRIPLNVVELWTQKLLDRQL